jgi:hypothetical protein
MRIRTTRSMAILAAMVAGGITVASTGTARADVTPPTGTWSEIVAGYLDQEACLDDPGGADQVGDGLELWHCHGYDSRGSSQRWFSAAPTSLTSRPTFLASFQGGLIASA